MRTGIRRVYACMRADVDELAGRIARRGEEAEAEGTTVTSLVEQALRELLAKSSAGRKIDPLPIYDSPESRLRVDLSDRDRLFSALDGDGPK